MAVTEREKKWTLTDEEIEKKISLVRRHLKEAQRLYGELLKDGVFADFYSNGSMVHGIPDNCRFKRNRMETFG